MKLFIPINKHHSIQHPPWFTSDIRHDIKRLRTLRHRIKLHPTQNIMDTIASLEKTLQSKISSAKLDFESSLISNFASNNNNKIYKYLKSISKSNNLPTTVHLDANIDFDKANLFNQYFYSVFHNSLDLPNIDDLPTIADSLQCELQSIEITIVEALISLNVDKSSGIDEISPRGLQACAEALCEPLHYLFTLAVITLCNCASQVEIS